MRFGLLMHRVSFESMAINTREVEFDLSKPLSPVHMDEEFRKAIQSKQQNKQIWE